MKRKDLVQTAAGMSTITVGYRQYVIRSFDRVDNLELFSQPNFRNLRKALCGVLKDNQTLDKFRTKWINKKYKRLKEI